MTDGVINFVYWNGKPALIKEKEIQIIKRFLDEHENVELVKIELSSFWAIEKWLKNKIKNRICRCFILLIEIDT
jgi:transcription antitermination factor NusG